jgi:hypothetical protein
MTSLGHTVRELRQRSFTGRHEEVAVFRDALAAPGVLFVHGAGGVGKSALLDVFAGIATEKGLEPVRVDARHLALGRGALPVPAGDVPAVLLIDTYELLELIDDWVREQYLPSLPASCLVVITGDADPDPVARGPGLAGTDAGRRARQPVAAGRARLSGRRTFPRRCATGC